MLSAACSLIVTGPARALSEGDLAIYAAAFAAASNGQWVNARALAATADDPLPGLVIYARDLARSGNGDAFATLDDFIESHPDFHRTGAVLRAAERRVGDALPAAEVIGWFGVRPPETGAGLAALAAALAEQGRGDDALALVAGVWRHVRLDRDDFDRLLAAVGDGLSQADHAARLDELLWQNREEEAEWMLALLPAGYTLLAEARLRLANNRSGVDQAIAAVPADFAGDEGLMFERVRWRRRHDLTDGAIALMGQMPASTRHADSWWSERAILMRRPFNDGDPAAAYPIAADHRQTEGLGLAEAEFFAGWLALRHLGRPGDALGHFERLYQSVTAPISRSRGAYWIGRALDALGDGSQADDWYRTAAAYPYTFYGQLAAGELGLPSVGRLDNAVSVSDSQLSAYREREEIRLARALLELGEWREAYWLLYELGERETSPEQRALLGRACLELGLPEMAVRAAKWAVSDGTVLLDTLYPLHPLPGLAEGSDRALILGLIRQESEFGERAVSPADARGLMQLMPATATVVARELDIPHELGWLTSDAAHNIQLGSSYLNGRIALFGGSYIMSIAAYNAGDNRSSSWAGRYGDPRLTDVHGAIDWIESIPFNETRNYVMRVLESTQVYRYRLGEETGPGLLEQDLTR